MRHVEVNQLWLQDKVVEGSVKIIKIPGTGNQADILTKHDNAQTLGNHLGLIWIPNQWGQTSSHAFADVKGEFMCTSGSSFGKERDLISALAVFGWQKTCLVH